MIRLWSWILAIGTAISAASDAGRAADKTTSHAVIVGAGKFSDAALKPRQTATADIQAIYDLLSDPKRGNIPAANITLLGTEADAKRNSKTATKAAILESIKSAAEKAGKDDTLLIFLTLQGGASGEKPCLFAADSTFAERQKNAIFASEIEAAVKNLKCENTAVFCDFFMKGFESKDAVLAPNINEYVRAFLGLKENDPDQEPPAGRGVFLMGNGLQPPLTVGKNGLFAAAILEALGGKADKEGYEADSLITTDELKTHLEKNLVDLIRPIAKTNEERNQRVIFIGRPIHFTLARNPESAVQVESRLKKFAELSASAKLAADVREEGTKLLTRMPKLKAMQDLRKSYQKFSDGDLNADQLATARERILAGMKLKTEDADSFADKLLKGLGFIKANYIKKLELAEMVGNGIKGLYLRTEVKMPDDIKERLSKIKDASDADLRALLRDARIPIGKREDLDENKDVEITMNASIRRLVDDYTTYIDKDRVEEVDNDIDGRFTGIGVQIRRDIARDGMLVVTPIRNSPAYKAGVLTGDFITGIIRDEDPKGNKLEKTEEISTKGMEVSDARKLILGLPGTKVKLKIERQGEKEPVIKEITRGVVRVESVYGYKRDEKDDSWDYYIDPKSKIAYLYLTQFARNSADDMKAVVQKLGKEGVKGMILDLRFNPGGFLDVAVNMCDLFIDDGVIVSVRPGNTRDRERFIKGRSQDSYLDFPMVCLVNDGSASGSEILAACLQDHNRAVVMGERSFGKGSVQNVEKFPATQGKIKLTTATFWPPSGRNLNKASTTGKEEEDWGVRPDKGFALKLERAEKDELFDRIYNWAVIPRRDLPPTDKPKEFKDRQLDMALEYLRGQIKGARADKSGF